jgi:hypothetical protein
MDPCVVAAPIAPDLPVRASEAMANTIVVDI